MQPNQCLVPRPRPHVCLATANPGKGSYRINGPAFVYSDQDTGRAITILGFPTDKLVDIE